MSTNSREVEWYFYLEMGSSKCVDHKPIPTSIGKDWLEKASINTQNCKHLDLLHQFRKSIHEEVKFYNNYNINKKSLNRFLLSLLSRWSLYFYLRNNMLPFISVLYQESISIILQQKWVGSRILLQCFI